jgi:hypothetical protein
MAIQRRTQEEAGKTVEELKREALDQRLEEVRKRRELQREALNAKRDGRLKVILIGIDSHLRAARKEFQEGVLDLMVGEVAKKPDPQTGDTGSFADFVPMFLEAPYNFPIFAKAKSGEVAQVRFRQIEQNGVQVFDFYRTGTSTTVYRRPEFPQLITAKDQKEAEEEFARREARQGAKV